MAARLTSWVTGEGHGDRREEGLGVTNSTWADYEVSVVKGGAGGLVSSCDLFSVSVMSWRGSALAKPTGNAGSHLEAHAESQGPEKNKNLVTPKEGGGENSPWRSQRGTGNRNSSL